MLQNRLMPPTLNDLAACHDKVRRLYSTAYGWPAPPLPPAERASYADDAAIHQGLDHPVGSSPPGRWRGPVVAGGIASNYTEDATLAEPRAPDAEEA